MKVPTTEHLGFETPGMFFYLSYSTNDLFRQTAYYTNDGVR